MTALLWLLTALLAGSIGWNLIQFAARKKRDASLAEISSKLRRIVANETSERLLLFTDDKYLQELVQDIEGYCPAARKWQFGTPEPSSPCEKCWRIFRMI